MSVVLWGWLGCGSVEPRLDCDAPEAGDLAGYCALGEAHGRDAGASSGCEDTGAPDEVAEGPGGCEAVADAVLAAEQAAYARCWRRGWEEARAAAVDSGCS